ncbi:MAG TPA: hypothetical protein VGC44_16050, partial [Longimicrobiales bacterium]
LLHEDYLDPYYADALAVRLEQQLGKHVQLHLRGAAAEHTTAMLTQDSAEFRMVQPIDEGRAYELSAGVQRSLPETAGLRWAGALNVDVVNFESAWFTRPRLELRAQYDSESKATSFTTTLRASAPISGDLPRQYQVLLGGRETLPGYGYRVFGGDSYLLVNAEASRSLWEPWVRLRAFGAFGVTDVLGDDPYPRLRPVTDPVLSGGAGVSLFWDVVRFDLAYGDKWRGIFSIQPNLRDIL